MYVVYFKYALYNINYIHINTIVHNILGDNLVQSHCIYYPCNLQPLLSMVDGVTGFPLESAPLHVEEESRGMRGGVTTPSLKMEVSLVVEVSLIHI